MYQKILIALDNTASDAALLAQVGKLAALLQSEVLLVHVADGWAARNFDRFQLAESEEMKEDRRYLDETAEKLKSTHGLAVGTRLALGNPPDEILKVAYAETCDLIAMASHGHKFLGDIWHGSTINRVRHNTNITILIVRAERK
ncbi:MAG: universal stress protein [Verrucomicrobia bacterium]|nr:universal stress protein [Verrucomicrobiota bacterium]